MSALFTVNFLSNSTRIFICMSDIFRLHGWFAFSFQPCHINLGLLSNSYSLWYTARFYSLFRAGSRWIRSSHIPHSTSSSVLLCRSPLVVFCTIIRCFKFRAFLNVLAHASFVISISQPMHNTQSTRRFESSFH